MIRKDLLFDSPIGIVKIWNPERQFELGSWNARCDGLRLKVVVVQPSTGEYSKDDVAVAKLYELRLRGFYHEEK